MGKRKISDWLAVVHDYENSNLSVEEFCTKKGIHPNTFYRNRKRYQHSNTTLVKIPVKKQEVWQHSQSIRIQFKNYIVTVPEGVNTETLGITLRILKDLA